MKQNASRYRPNVQCLEHNSLHLGYCHSKTAWFSIIPMMNMNRTPCLNTIKVNPGLSSADNLVQYLNWRKITACEKNGLAKHVSIEMAILVSELALVC